MDDGSLPVYQGLVSGKDPPVLSVGWKINTQSLDGVNRAVTEAVALTNTSEFQQNPEVWSSDDAMFHIISCI